METIHRFRNNQKAIPLGNRGWDEAHENHLLDIRSRPAGREAEGREDGLPIRLVRVGEEERTVACSREPLERGFCSSSVFFPVVEKGKAGLRADNRPEDILAFSDAVREVTAGAAV